MEVNAGEQVINQIDKEELAELALSLGNIRGPVGYEQEAGEYVYNWLKDKGFDARKQLVTSDRFNVIAVLKGSGGGKTLAFNSHLDTLPMYAGDAQAMVENHSAYRSRRSGDKLFGLAVLNDRGPMAAWMMAAYALKKSGITLKGDVVLTSVVGEIGAAPVDEYQGERFLGKGIGTRHAVSQGPPVDYALVAETTDFGIAWAECGVLYIKIMVTGERVYSPRLVYPEDVRKHPNSILRMQKIIEALSNWAPIYSQENSYEYPCGKIIPKLNIGAIRGGLPPRPSETSSLCSIYVDLWLPPYRKPKVALKQMDEILKETGIPYEKEVYLYRQGYVAKGIDPLRESVAEAYQKLFKEPVPPVKTEVTSMWRDLNVYNEVGIPSLTYGPTRHQDTESSAKYLHAEDLKKTAQIYALVAMDICGM